MTVTTVVEPIDRLAEHGSISIAFRVERVLALRLVDGGLGGMALTETVVPQPWVKDYDDIEGEGPTRWARRFDVRNWGLVAAFDGAARVGGAVIAYDSPGVNLRRGRRDRAILWDLRVGSEVRGQGVGTALFQAAEGWARERGVGTLEVETQNINVPACRFYRSVGCTLASIDTRAYPDLPDEAQLMWTKRL